MLEKLDEDKLGADRLDLVAISERTPEQNIGNLALDLTGFDFDAIMQELQDIDVDRIIIEEFQTSLDFSGHNTTERKSIQQVIAHVEFFLNQPAIQNAMSQLDAIARQFAHMCNGADGHGGFSVSSLTGIAKNFFEQGMHSENDGHNHGIDAFKKMTIANEDDTTHDKDNEKDEYEWVFVDGRWVRRKKAKKK